MTYEDIQEVQNAAAMVEIDSIRFEERLNRQFANAADAHAFLQKQPNADKLYVRHTGHFFTVKPIVILDADNIPVRDGDILFLRDNRYCRAKIVKRKRSDDAHNILLQGMSIEGDTNAVVEDFGENDGRIKIVTVKHHRRDKKERKSLSEWIYNIVAFIGGTFELFPLLAMLIVLTLPFWIVVLIIGAAVVIKDEKALKKAETAEAALIFADEGLNPESKEYEPEKSKSEENEYNEQCCV